LAPGTITAPASFKLHARFQHDGIVDDSHLASCYPVNWWLIKAGIKERM